MPQALLSKNVVTIAISFTVGIVGYLQAPFPVNDPLLALMQIVRPNLFLAIRIVYTMMFFTTPLVLTSILYSLTYIFMNTASATAPAVKLPLYTPPHMRGELQVFLGELHHPTRPVPSLAPRWLIIPESGLYTGIAIVGAIGTGKTTCLMYPTAEQLLAFKADDPEKRIGGLLLEVKGDFCHHVRRLLEKYEREDDYLELTLDTFYRYNPLHNDLEAYALAFSIASTLNNLFGHGKEPFWQQAYTNLVKFIILLHKVLYDYVTLFDVYECAINPVLLEQKISEGEKLFDTHDRVLVSVRDFVSHEVLEPFQMERHEDPLFMQAIVSSKLLDCLEANKIKYRTLKPDGDGLTTKAQQFAAVRRWFYHDWKRIENRLRTSIVEGITVFLSLFDDSPAVKKIFCPPKECYDIEQNADGKYGIPLPPFSTMIESGIVCAFNLPLSTNPGLTRALGTMTKQDFQRAVLNRISKMEEEPERYFRQVFFMCDEYHAFATVGESDPSGDEKFFSLSRQSKCIAVVATQSISSLRSTLSGEAWRTLLQTFRTKVFLALSDDFSMRIASELCGKAEQLKPSYSISENAQDAKVSMITGRATAHKATISTSKTYTVHRDYIFDQKAFYELKNAQAIVLAYDGVNPLPPTYCYLKPYYLDPNRSYFESGPLGGQ